MVDEELERPKCSSVLSRPFSYLIESRDWYELTLLEGEKVEYMPVTMILEPGTTLAVRYLPI